MRLVVVSGAIGVFGHTMSVTMHVVDPEQPVTVRPKYGLTIYVEYPHPKLKPS
ncbi:MAG: hypothetical protein ACK518_01810 [bacterium]